MKMTIYEVEIYVRDIESNEVIERESHWIELWSGQSIEVWIDDRLKYKDDEPIIKEDEK